MFVSHRFAKFIVLIALLGTVAVNALANILMINGQGTGDVAHRLQVYFMPADFTFLIWSVIYLSLFTFALYQFSSRAPQEVLMHTRPWFILSCFANCLWIIFWHYNLFLYTLFEMLVLLVAVAMVYQDVQRYLPRPTRLQWWCIQFPASLYLAWICVATIANVSIVLDLAGWNGWNLTGPVWAATVMGVAVLLGGYFVWYKRDIVFAAVVVWALLGIADHFAELPVMLWTAVACCIALLGMSAVRLVVARR